MPPIIHWFRRDLRLHDNASLSAALHNSDGHVIPLFILDDALLRSPRMSAARVIFLLESLEALDKAMRDHGSRLVIRHGDPLEQLPKLVQDSGAEAVYVNSDFTPFAKQRDEAVRQVLDGKANVVFHHDVTIFPPDSILSNQGKPYSVFTPYKRNWLAQVEHERARFQSTTRLPGFAALPSNLPVGDIPTAQDLGYTTEQELPKGGEAAGLHQLAAFARRKHNGIRSYDERRNEMAEPGTSRMSAYLHFGCVSPLACLRAALDAADNTKDTSGIDTWITELAWRDFYTQIMHHFPYVLRGAFKREFDAIEWDNDQEHFDAWREGRTGYPIVDAAMRQLLREGWMHNRGRMIVASFLVKDLLIDWRWGERHFLQYLVDGNHAANNGGWQWSAGTGTDAQPFFRVFNPVSQGQRFDPDGTYVRRYLPELANVDTKYIHAPWAMPVKEQQRVGVMVGRDYPAPIVDHADGRDRALAAYRAARKPS